MFLLGQLRDQSTHERGLDQNRHDPPYGAKARLRILRQVLSYILGTFEQLWIVQDLHDGLCQQLAGIQHAADLITKKLPSNSAPKRVDSFKAHDLELIETETVSGALLTS